MVDFASLKTLFPLTIKEDVATAHINRAVLDFKEIDFKSDELELEVIGSKAMYYLAPLLWVDIQARVDEYDESMHTFKDIQRFQSYWLLRSSSALNSMNKKPKDFLWAAV